MKSITEHKAEATLNKVFRYSEGVMTRKEWLNMQRIKGATVTEEVKRNYSAEEKLRSWLDSEKLKVPLGNPNYPTTAHYLKEKERLSEGIYKTVYHLQYANQNLFFEITKTEYDYFNSKLIEQDGENNLATEENTGLKFGNSKNY